MNCKVITYWDGVLHILRNPYGFSEDIVRHARLAAADFIESALRVEPCKGHRWVIGKDRVTRCRRCNAVGPAPLDAVPAQNCSK